MYVNVVQYNVYKNIFKGNLGLCHNIVWVIVDAPYIGLILFSSFKMLIGTKTFEFSWKPKTMKMHKLQCDLY